MGKMLEDTFGGSVFGNETSADVAELLRLTGTGLPGGWRRGN